LELAELDSTPRTLGGKTIIAGTVSGDFDYYGLVAGLREMIYTRGFRIDAARWQRVIAMISAGVNLSRGTAAFSVGIANAESNVATTTVLSIILRPSSRSPKKLSYALSAPRNF
jgi:hypothetical protein